MLIVLDTNVLVANPAFDVGASAILLDYARRTESQIVLSALVLDELCALRIRSLSAQWDSYVRAAGKVRAFFPQVSVPSTRPDFARIAQRHVDALKQQLRVADGDVLPVAEHHLREAVRRAMHRLPPCTDRGEEIRDAILWLQVIELANENASSTVAFISGNVRQFASKDGSLMETLAGEVTTGHLVYHTSVDAFAKRHATPIEFVTADWIQERLSADTVCAEAEEEMLSIARAYTWRRDFGDDPEIGSYWLDFDDFYVYEMRDGTLRIVAIWFGTVEIITDEPEYDYDFNPATGRHEYHYRAFGPTFRSKEVEVVVTTEAIVRHQQLESWKVIEVDLA